MDYFLILVLGVAVFDVWRRGKDARDKQREEIESLEREVRWLREQLTAHQKSHAAQLAPAPAPPRQPEPIPASPQLAPPPEPAASHAPAPPVAAFTAPAHTIPPPPTKPWVPPVPPPVPRPEPEPEPPARTFSLEERLGANWLNKLGIALVVLGVASFLAFKLQTWGPAGKVLCGYSVSFAILAGGVWLERKPVYRLFARSGIGGGWALAFFTTFALYHVPAARVLTSIAADLVLMLLVAAGMVAHSLRYRSQVVTGLAFLLGFATVLTSHLEVASGTVVFSLTASAILALALVIVTTLRHWTWLELGGLIAVYLTHLVWLTNVLPADHGAFTQFWPSTALILLYWLIFRAAYVFRVPREASEESQSSLTAVLNSTGVLGLLKFQSAHPEWAFWALAALGVIEMALAFYLRPRRRLGFIVLSTIASVLLVAAVPFKFHGVSWPVLWLVEAQVLAVCGLRLGEPVFRRLGLLAGVITGGVLAFHDVLPLLDLRLAAPDLGSRASLTVALALAALLYWVHGEFYPRRWPQIAEDDREAFALRVTSWLALAAAATALWVAVPDLWLPIGWLALVLVLGWLARRFAFARLALEADALALCAGAALIFHRVAPLALFRLDSPDPGRHPGETAILALAALCYWAYAEAYPRLLPCPEIDATGWTQFLKPTASSLGTFAAAAALWVALPAVWVPVGWLALVLLLGFAADWLKAPVLALQADLLAVASAFGFFAWTVWSHGWWDHRVPFIATVALLYAGMRRRTLPLGLRNYVAPAYSWAATSLLALLAADLSLSFSSEFALAPVWAGLGLALFEIGRFTRKGFLRWQGLALVGVAFTRYLASDLMSGGPATLLKLSPAGNLIENSAFSLVNSALLEVLILAAAGYWLLERARDPERSMSREHLAGLAADSVGTLSIALWFAYRFPSPWVPVPGGEAWVSSIWAAMATVLLGLAWLLRRRAFLAQALALVLAVLGRAFFLDLWADTPAGFWHGPLFHLSLAALILMAALPFAFRLRGEGFFPASALKLPADLDLAFRSPHQVFFFAPFALMVVALAAKLNSGHITIAWSLLGLAVFLFALAVGERSYRLAGLSLLLLCVVKILLMDVWKLAPAERYPTLIVLGLALLAVSFLYTRFAKVIRRYL